MIWGARTGQVGERGGDEHSNSGSNWYGKNVQERIERYWTGQPMIEEARKEVWQKEMSIAYAQKG